MSPYDAVDPTPVQLAVIQAQALDTSHLTMQGWNGRSLETHGAAHALQGHFMEAVERDRSLQSLATDAFRSSIRAYAAYPAAVKDVFHVKKLHLGHVAHSFALRCTLAPQAAPIGIHMRLRLYMGEIGQSMI